MTSLLTIDALSVHYPVGQRGLTGRPERWVRAVDNVSLTVEKGETLGLVGESGSGKTTLGRAVLRAVEPTGGRVLFDGPGGPVDIAAMGRVELRAARRRMQMIFQDPYSSLNPRMTVFDIIAEPLVALGLSSGAPLRERVVEMARRCGLQREQLARYPHAFSGGQRQRIAIARALVVNPDFVVADEPVSALDVSIQAQILNLMDDLKRELGLTVLFIAHDIAAVSRTCGRIAVMYLGRIVEIGEATALIAAPRHPYTEALMSAVPVPDPERPMRPIVLTGERPNPANPPSGCHFHTRCRYAVDRCRAERPPLRAVGTGPEPRLAACHRAEELTLAGASDLETAPPGPPPAHPEERPASP